MRAFWVAWIFVSALAQARELSVVTLNAGLPCIGPGCVINDQDDSRARAPRVGRWLKTLDADVVVLQEVVREAERQAIQRELGYPHAFSPSLTTGLVVFSKFPLRGGIFRPFRWQGTHPVECQRLAAGWWSGVLSINVAAPDGPFRLVATHGIAHWPDLAGFAGSRDALTPERLMNLLEIRRFIFTSGGHKRPLIVVGDFNFNQDSDEYVFFTRLLGLNNALKQATEKQGGDWKSLCTFCPENAFVKAQKNPGEKVLDYVWVSSHFRVHTAEIPPDAGVSDHRAVLARLETKPKHVAVLPKVSLAPAEIDSFLSFVNGASFSAYCWLARSNGADQKAETRAFLEDERSDGMRVLPH